MISLCIFTTHQTNIDTTVKLQKSPLTTHPTSLIASKKQRIPKVCKQSRTPPNHMLSPSFSSTMAGHLLWLCPIERVCLQAAVHIEHPFICCSCGSNATGPVSKETKPKHVAKVNPAPVCLMNKNMKQTQLIPPNHTPNICSHCNESYTSATRATSKRHVMWKGGSRE